MIRGISPCLWFDGKAEEAAALYTSIFEDSETLDVIRYGESTEAVSGQTADSVMQVDFRICGQRFTALNGGPLFEFTPAISFVVECETQAEIDALWTALSEGGEAQRCGWLRDRFGVSWQIVPRVLEELRARRDGDGWERTMQAMLQMDKLDIAGLQRAFNGS